MTLAYLAMAICIKLAACRATRLLSAMASQIFVVVSLDRLCAYTTDMPTTQGACTVTIVALGDARAAGMKSHTTFKLDTRGTSLI